MLLSKGLFLNTPHVHKSRMNRKEILRTDHFKEATFFLKDGVNRSCSS